MPPSNSINAMPSDSGFIDNPAGNESTNDELESKELRYIRQALPGSTHAERVRFLTDRKGDTEAAIEKLRNYLEWRKQHCNDDLMYLDSWTYATQLAIQSSRRGKDDKANGIDDTFKLPCTVFMQEHTQTSKNDKGDNTITKKKYLQHLPARIDTKLADTSIYALALAIYIDHALDRTSTEKITLVIDVRPGLGWANIKAIQLLPFIQSTSRLLCDLHPLRLDSCVIFPVPKVTNVLWKAVKPFMGTDTSKKVCLVSGPAGRKDKVPKNLSEYLDAGLITEFEERRKSYERSVK
mmetsp:Transcript_41454/g.74724  ORF Transcript_41454/g.74724 Transcript_41454/m.74724 type:complete len:294 (+) Transcript_41454:120-1001(+)